jgi:hypothetical protein
MRVRHSLRVAEKEAVVLDVRGDLSHAPSARARRALVVVPGQGHWLPDREGGRLAEGLRHLGFRVDRLSFAELDEPCSYDLGLIICPPAVVEAAPSQKVAWQALGSVRRWCRTLLGVLHERLDTPRAASAFEIAEILGMEAIADLGLCAQSEHAPPGMRARYRFLHAGLTAGERDRARGLSAPGPERPLPWALVGHLASHRAALVDQLVQEAGTDGFVYLGTRTPVREQGSPHLSPSQLEHVLKQTRCYVWSAAEIRFHLESERFRMALLAGCLPVKVLFEPLTAAGVPFHGCLVTRARLREVFHPDRLAVLWEAFRGEYLDLPTLEASLAGLLAEWKLAELTSGARQTAAAARFATWRNAA